ncbi:MAG TPA: hypothetical protein VFN13_14140 [Rudaea sp.]|nr:hypothetical protein [Rudaea sp.]
MKRLVLLSLLLLLSTVAQAQYVSTRLGAIQPYTGMYYDRNQSGSGLSVDVGPGGMLFLQFATYDTAGNQVNYISQPIYTPSSEQTRASTGVIGTATGQAFYVTGGQCPGCPYNGFPTVHPLDLYPTFTWTRPRHVDMSFTQNGQTFTYHFDAGNFEGKNDEEFLPGTFAISVLSDSSFAPNGGPNHGMLAAVDMDIVKVVPAPFTSVTAAPGTDPSIMPPAGASFYVLQCQPVVPTPTNTAATPCSALPNRYSEAANDQLTQQTLLWFDPATGTAGMEGVNPDGTVGPAAIAGDLYITPNTLTAHLGTRGHNANGSSWYQPGQIFMSVTLTRVPDPTVRDCYGMNTTPVTSTNYPSVCGK